MTRARSGRWRKAWIPALIGVLAALAPARAGSETLTIAVASNFAVPMKVLADRFEASTGRRVVVVAGSTGKHYAQVLHGAPFDVFFAADAERPQRLEDGGWAVSGSRFTYAVGRLVLWSPTPGLVDAEGRVLETATFRHLALANPRLAPYGRAARQTLERRGLWDGLSDRLVLGENVAQAFQMIATGNAELGFVALAQLNQLGQLDQPDRPKPPVAGSHWLVPSALHEPIEQQTVLLRDSPVARAFLDHVRSPASRDLIRSYGYELPPLDAADHAGAHALR